MSIKNEDIPEPKIFILSKQNDESDAFEIIEIVKKLLHELRKPCYKFENYHYKNNILEQSF